MFKTTFAVFTLIVTLAACSSETNNSTNDKHVLDTQAKALEKAKATEQLIGEAVMQQEREIDKQSQ